MPTKSFRLSSMPAHQIRTGQLIRGSPKSEDVDEADLHRIVLAVSG
jgi:hypothetical protein